ncbi:DUF302 domain-containing protein [Oscillochloris sp. ZM17-4]|uniref:DUF302 domain-containing protein n=1 Tax=Oscillochloris sp. ZM17-4 TaxID=2866714 RepID=UPI001C7370A1|nr:DUF302 domain-containing protein [Oscillochloris sp. ZM17-4]
METTEQFTRHAYGYTLVTPLGYAEAVEAVTLALKSEGFGVLTTIDVQATMRQKLSVERTPYTILGACNPPLAHQALSAEPEIGLLLPCNVVVYVDDAGQTVISAIDPEAMFAVVQRDDLSAIAAEVGTRLRRVLGQLPVAAGA